jgi:hypothetical protein
MPADQLSLAFAGGRPWIGATAIEPTLELEAHAARLYRLPDGMFRVIYWRAGELRTYQDWPDARRAFTAARSGLRQERWRHRQARRKATKHD